MEAIIIQGSEKEIAALVSQLQERQREPFIPHDAEDEIRNQKCCC